MVPSIKDQIATCGYAFVQDYRPEVDTLGVATELGVPLAPWEGGLIQKLVPRASAAPNTYSGIYGLDRFPFHTDLAHWRQPPRYLLLRCIKGFLDVPTLLIDGQTIVDTVTLDVLTRAIVKPRRPQNGAVPLLRLCEQVDNGHRVRWDEVFLKPASRVGEGASQQITTLLSEVDPRSIALANAGDTLLVDNWRMLHARSRVFEGRESRMIERVYLEALI
ncbi:TauD/TfdA family dioxygenase [Hoeflea sp. 108]|uniref:TauD/TfdA family dioxygenase n=1 Tax=Hoeflea sp. 108 TaxID=1116369 RepID=UPI00036DFDB4|nr:TauD/TfdA family dioxygenase [Hoeflea sp. 108]